jgi:CARDB
MIKTVSLVIILLAFQPGFAQTATVNTAATRTSPEKLSTSRAKNSSATLSLVKEEKNIPVPKLPDLRITAIQVKFYNSASSDSSRRYLEISYTIRNDGVVAVELEKVGVGGKILSDPASSWEYSGCGSGAFAGSGIMLNAGAEFSGSFRCYTKQAVADVKYYKLTVDTDMRINEISEANNTALTSVFYQ